MTAKGAGPSGRSVVAVEWPPDGLAVAAHDVRTHEVGNVLAAIGAGIQALATVANDDQHDAKLALVSAVQRELSRLSMILSDVAPRTTTFSVHELVDEIAPCAATMVKHFTVEVLQSATLTGQRERLASALLNVVVNAARYGHGRIAVRAGASPTEVTITVDDDGPGFSPGESRLVAHAYRRGAAAHGVPGSGIGLALVADTVRRHNGTLSIGTSSWGGARVVMRLPRASSLTIDQFYDDRDKGVDGVGGTQDPHLVRSMESCSSTSLVEFKDHRSGDAV